MVELIKAELLVGEYNICIHIYNTFYNNVFCNSHFVTWQVMMRPRGLKDSDSDDGGGGGGWREEVEEEKMIQAEY